MLSRQILSHLLLFRFSHLITCRISSYLISSHLVLQFLSSVTCHVATNSLGFLIHFRVERRRRRAFSHSRLHIQERMQVQRQNTQLVRNYCLSVSRQTYVGLSVFPRLFIYLSVRVSIRLSNCPSICDSIFRERTRVYLSDVSVIVRYRLTSFRSLRSAYSWLSFRVISPMQFCLTSRASQKISTRPFSKKCSFRVTQTSGDNALIRHSS